MTLPESLAEGLDHVVELSDQLALDHHLLAGHLQLEVLVHHLSDIIGDKLVHFGLSHELGDDVEDDGALFVPELLKDAVVRGNSTGKQVSLLGRLVIGDACRLVVRGIADGCTFLVVSQT